MRGVSIWTALAFVACAVPSADTESAGTSVAISYAAETDVAIDRAIVTGRSVGRDADMKHRDAIEALRKRTDAAERLVVRARNESNPTRLQYLLLLGSVEHKAVMVRQYLNDLALRPPTRAIPSADPTKHNDDQTDYERMLGESFAAASALVQQGDWNGLLDVYANADVNVAAVAAANASAAGMLDDSARQVLNTRGITGSFQPVEGASIVRDATFGPSAVSQPMEGPQ